MNRRRNSVRWLIVAFVVAVAAASAQASMGSSGAKGGSRQGTSDRSDVVSRYLRSHANRTNIGAGSLEVKGASAPPDAFERYASAHPYGVGVAPASVLAPGGFRWSDYGAGVGTGVVLVLLVGAGLVATPRRRRGTQPAVGG
jgi:hypothetical protein